MTEGEDKKVPRDFDSEDRVPERIEDAGSDFNIEPTESDNSDFNLEPTKKDNTDYFSTQPIEPGPKPKNKTLIIAIIAFAIVASGFFSYYFINQDEIDSKIIQNTSRMDLDEILASKYNIGEFGSEHAHAALVVFANEEKINFGSPRFQVASKYIHFEDHNPYLIHMHATNVPLDMLFTSIGMKITPDCVTLNYKSNDETYSEYCSDEQSLVVYLNGEQYYSDISQYVIKHNDRILISYGDTEHLPMQLNYLESLEIYDVPKKTPKYSDNEIFV